LRIPNTTLLLCPDLEVRTRSRARVRRSAHSLSSCPSALDFVLDRRTWNGHNLRCFSIEQCSALPLVPRYTIRHSRGLTLSSSDLAPLRRKLLLPFLLCFVVRLLRTGADPSAGSLLSSPHGALSYGSKATRLTVVLPLRLSRLGLCEMNRIREIRKSQFTACKC